jgi:hypothetical protein
MELITLTPAAALDLQAEFPPIEFKIVDGAVKGVRLAFEDGQELVIEESGYNIHFRVRATRTTYTLSWMQPVADDMILMEKSFKSESERSDYIAQHLSSADSPEYVLDSLSELA